MPDEISAQNPENEVPEGEDLIEGFLSEEVPEADDVIDVLSFEETPVTDEESDAFADVATPEDSAEGARSTAQETLKDTRAVTGPPLTSDPPKLGESGINDNDRLMAALAYFLWFLGPLIILVSPDMKARPYLQYHAVQALGLNVVLASRHSLFLF